MPQPTPEPQQELDSEMLCGCFERMRAGDAQAQADLVRSCMKRLERLARKMLRSYPSVKRWEDTEDVLQNSLVRLMRAVRDVQPQSTKAFFGLAAEIMRRELLDLARHHTGPLSFAKNHGSVAGQAGDASPLLDPAAEQDDVDLERWAAFHEAVAQLPSREREVIGLSHYHGWSQAQIAELFQVDERTVRRWRRTAEVMLNKAMGALGGDVQSHGTPPSRPS